jgi:hypothetical protein
MTRGIVRGLVPVTIRGKPRRVLAIARDVIGGVVWVTVEAEKKQSA